MTDRDPVTMGLRVDDANPGHTRLSVFVGRNPGARGHAGHLVLRTDEWDEIRTAVEDATAILRGEVHRAAPIRTSDGNLVGYRCECGKGMGPHVAEIHEHRTAAEIDMLRDVLARLLPDRVEHATTVADVPTGGLL